MTGYTCPECGFKLWLPLFDLSQTSLGLYDDARFPGRCLLTWSRHVEHLTDLSAEEACQFVEDGRRAAAAIREVTGAARINYAILGNVEPHLHLHLILRFETDPKADRPPWEDPRPQRPLEPRQVEALSEQLRNHLRTNDAVV